MSPERTDLAVEVSVVERFPEVTGISRPIARRDLEREISSLLQLLDNLETDAEEPGRREALAPDLARAEMDLTATLRTLRELPPAATASTPPPRRVEQESSARTSGRRRRRLRTPANGRRPSANAYLGDM